MKKLAISNVNDTKIALLTYTIYIILITKSHRYISESDALLY